VAVSDKNTIAGLSDNQPSSDAQSIEYLASTWFGRRQFWSWSEEDQAQLDTWLAESLAHQVAYWRLAAAWDRTERLNAIMLPMPMKSEPRRTHNGWAQIALRVAGVAVVVAAMIGGFQKLQEANSKIEAYSTATGEMKTLTLADGSSIELNTDTSLSVDLRDGKRAVQLKKGEAYFQVHHDATRPFTVTVGNHRVTDLGTKFLVRGGKRSVQVSLIEGKAQLQSGDGPNARSVLLTPGDVAVASADTLSVNKKAAATLAEKLGWRHGVIIFDNATLGDAAAEFNRYNRIQLVIEDPAVARIPIAGKFPTNGVDRFADVIEHVFGLRIQTKDGAKVISH
jgi:transmembrane sensor